MLSHGQLIRKARVAQGVSLRELAKAIGVSCTFLADVERGKGRYLSASACDEVADLLGLEPRELVIAKIRSKRSVKIPTLLLTDDQIEAVAELMMGKSRH